MKHNTGPTPNINMRGLRPGCASTILARLFFAALVFFSALGSSNAHAQSDGAADAPAEAAANDAPASDAAAAPSDAASSPRAPQGGQVDRIIRASGEETGVRQGTCEGGVSPTCGEIIVSGVTYACYHESTGGVDPVQDQTVTVEQFRRFRHSVTRRFAALDRRVTAVEGVNQAQDERLTALESYDQQFFGWSADASPRERMRIARETGRYLHDVIPSLFMEQEINRMEVDGELRGAIEAAERARRDFEARANDKFAELERGIAAINARLDAAAGRQWLGPSVGLFTSSCPNDHNCWTGVTVGFGYAGRPVSDSWFGVTGSLDLGHLWGRSGAYDGFLISARAAIGYQSPSNRWGIGIGGQLMAMLTLQTDGGMAFMGGGPMVAGWFKPTDWIRIGLEAGGMFGTVRVAGEREATGHGEDHSAFTGRGFLEIPIKAL